MKKSNFFFVLFIMILFVSIILSSCKNTKDNIKENIDIKIVSFCDAEEDDFKKYNCAFAGDNAELVVENYRLLKVTYNILNKNDFSIKVFNSNVIKNNDFYLVEDCIDLEPTYAISSNSSLDVDVYVYINNDLTDKDDILNKLYDLNIDFSYVV